MTEQPQNLNQVKNEPIIGEEPLVTTSLNSNGYAQPISPIPQQYFQPLPGNQIPMAQPYAYPSNLPNQPIIVNQYIPVQPIPFKTEPINMVCPFCKSNITTNVETEFNCLNCCFCCWNFVLWIIVQLVREKELNCTDATHKCPNCGQIIGKYNAC